MTGPALVPIHRALIRDRKNVFAYWQVTVTRLGDLLSRACRFEACADLVVVRWQIGDTVGWETTSIQNQRC